MTEMVGSSESGDDVRCTSKSSVPGFIMQKMQWLS